MTTSKRPPDLALSRIYFHGEGVRAIGVRLLVHNYFIDTHHTLVNNWADV